MSEEPVVENIVSEAEIAEIPPEETPLEVALETEEQPQEKPKRSRYQERIDELVREREEAREEAEQWRSETHRLLRQTETKGKIEVDMSDYPMPREDDYETHEEFQAALTERAAVKAVRLEDARKSQITDRDRQSEAQRQIEDWKAAGRKKIADFEVALADNLPITPDMAMAMTRSEYGHEVAYYLGKNPEQARRIAMMPLEIDRQIEMRRLFNKEANRKLPKQESSAPTATSPVGDRETITKTWNIYDKDIPYEEYKKLRMKQERERLGLA